MPDLLLAAALGAAFGAVAGLLTVCWVLSRRDHANPATLVEPPDPFISAELDRAAVRYATEKGRPEAAGLVADKLHLLYALGRRRRQS